MKEFSLELSVDRHHLMEAVKGLISTIFFYRAFGSIIPQTNEFLDVPYPFSDIPELEKYIDAKVEDLMTKIDSADTPLLSTTSSSSTPLGSPPTLKSDLYNNNNPYANIRFNGEDDSSEHVIASSMPNSPLNTNMDSTAHSISSMHLRSPNLKPFNMSSAGRNIASAGNTPQQSSNIKYTQVVINFYELRKLKKPSWFGKIEEEVNFEVWLLNIRTIKSLNDKDHISGSAGNIEGGFSIEKLQSHFEALIWQISDIADTNKDHIPTITSTEVLPFNYSIAIKSSGSNDSWREFIKKMLKDPII